MSLAAFLDTCVLAGVSFVLEQGELVIESDADLPDELMAEIRRRKDEILAWIAAANVPAPARDRVTRRERENGPDGVRLPLSASQQRLWLIDQLDGGSAHYNIPLRLRVEGAFNERAAEAALRGLVARHEPLRTVFVQEGEEPRQCIREQAELNLQRVDLRALTPQARADRVCELVAADVAAPFDLMRDPLLRATYVRLTEAEGLLLVNLHHIAADGLSMALVVREFATLYEAAAAGRPNPLPPLTLRYGDYAQWQQEWLAGDALLPQLAFWERQLADLPTLHSLPLDLPRPAEQSFAGATQLVHLDADATRALRLLARESEATLFMVLHATLCILLARHSSASDIVIGTPVANRLQKELESLVGFFVNTLVLRVDAGGNPSFIDFLSQVRAVNAQAQAHQEVPFESLVERLNPVRSTAHGPLFQVMLSLETQGAAALQLGDARLVPERDGPVAAKFDLSFNVTELGGGGLALEIEYATALFNAGTAARLAQHWSRLLRAVAKDPGQSLHALPMLDADEESALRGLLRGERVDFGRQLVHERIEAVAQRNPQAVAVQQGDEALSYGELDARANQVAHWLVSERGVGPEVRVGLCLDRSIELMVALLGVLKAGGAYVPLDPAYPLERLAYMAEDASLSTVLTQSGHRASLPLGDDRVVCLDEPALRARLAALPTGACAPRGLGPASLAYVIYTSGSTGRPKGVMIEHAALSNLAAVIGRHYSLTPEDGFLQFASINFDMSVEDVFGALCAGCRLVLRDDEWLRSPGEFWSRSEAQGVSVLDLPTAFWHELAMDDAAPAPGVRHISIGGEAVGRAQLQRWLERADTRGVRLVNTYGPTECTVDASFAELDGLEAGIGRLLPNYVGRVLDAHGALCPLGVPGELYLGGAGLARGYLNRPELTAERFVKDPCARDDDDAGRLYRTGDQVCLRADGSLQYLGRIDDQVKIRGFRIELGEIEACLAGHPAVAQAVVLAREDAAGDKQLVAYVSLSEGGEVTPGQLKEQLRQRLPQYMVPAHIVVLQALPLTPNGKVDKRALPAPEAGTEGFEAVLPLQGETEQRLAQIWSELLKLPLQRIGADANFFALGGHSLMVVRLIARLQAAGLHVAARTVFSAPSLRALAQALAAETRQQDLQHADYEVPPARIPEDCARVTPELLPLVSLNQETVDALVATVPGGAANVVDIYPLAPLQEGLLFHHVLQADDGIDPYLTPLLLEVTDRAALNTLLDALQRVVDRHDVLRTSVPMLNGEASVQVVWRKAYLAPQECVLHPGRDAQEQLQERLRAPHRLDLGRAPLLSVEYAQDPEAPRCFVLLRLHHLVCDHVGLEILQDELLAQLSGRGAALSPAPAYRDFVATVLHTTRTDTAQTFFQRELGDVDAATVPFGLHDVHGNGAAVREARRRLPPALSLRLREQARAHRVSPAALFHAAWAMVLAASSGREDVVFGTVFSGRLQGLATAQSQLGLSINTLPLRLRLTGQDAAGLLVQTQRALQETLPFEQASLALVKRCSGLPARTPLFSALLNFRHSRDLEGRGSGLARAGVRLVAAQERSNYPLSASIDDFGDGFGIDLQIAGDRDAASVAAWLETAVESLVDALASDSALPVLRLPVLPAAERSELLQALRGDRVPFATEACIHELVQAQAQRTPQAVAVQHAHGELSYGELEARANQLARWLRSQGVGPDQRVGLCVTRGPEMIVGLLAILKAGGAYVPLDAENPPERLRHMVTQGGLSLLLSQQGLRDRVTAALPEGVVLALLDEAGFEAELEALEDGALARAEGAGPQDLAYVIFTSGSTGAPKGAMVPHRGFVNLMAWYDALCLERGAEEAVLLLSNFSFDLTQKNVFTTLARGARLVLPAPGPFDPRAVCALIEERQVSVLNVTPSVFVALLEDGCAQQLGSLRSVVLGGEPIAYARLQEWHRASGCQLVNSYGPTECTDVSSYWVQQPSEDAQLRVPLGVAVPNVDLYVLDAHQGLVGVGVAGELCVGGVGVGRGYLARPELTAERFVSNPFHDPADPVSSTQLYRTGDLVRREADGSLQYLGRIDDQVKIRGFRIELGEIEAQLVRQPGVTAAVVLAREDVPGDKRLVGYVAAQTPLVPAELKAQLQQALPEYMVPAHIVVLQALPLTPNGKVDKRALPAPEGRVQDGQARQPLQGHIEQALAQIWAELLGLSAEHIGAEANFFELGGHSLTAVRLMSLLRQRLDVELGLREVFDARSLRDLANDVERAQGQAQRPRVTRRQGTDEEALPLSYAQTRLWFLDCYDGGSTHYHLPMALRLRGSFEADLAEQALRRVLDRQEALRTVFDGQAEAPRQRLRSAQGFALDRVDLGGLEREAREIRVQALALAHAQAPFDLRSDLLLRASYVKLAQDEGVLLINMHHIASDGWSVGLLVDEFATQYNALRSGRQDNPLAPLAVRYADYAQWQREWLDQDGALEKQLAYWERQLAGLPPVHALALDHARPAQQSFEGATQSFMVDAATTQRLRELGRRTHCTLFMVLHAGLSVLLARHASASDIVIGTPVANRLHKELEDVVGFFANTLVLRTDTSGNPSFEQLLAQVREVNLQAQAHQDVPFEMLVERLNPARSAQYGPLVQIVLNLEAGASAATEAGIALPGLRVTTLGRAVVSAKFELQFNVEEVQGGLALGIDYNCALFEAQTIERMAQHWQRLLHSIAADATLGIHDLPMLAQGESTELLHRLNVRRAVHAVEQGVHERFEAQVRQAPRAIAAEYEGESLSYAELDAQANRLARHLREQGVGVDSLVGLSVERGLPMLVGLLAILKAGGAYVPLDPAYPAGRLAYMVGDSGMKLVLSQSSLRDKLGEITAQTAGIQLLELDDAQLQQQLQRYSAEALERLPGQGPGNLAYIIYTSGSTGQPKGVQIEHANVVRLFESAKRHFAFDASDVWTMFHSYGFDFSVWEIWGALLHGGRLVIVPQAVARSAPEFYELLQQRGVTILNQTPSAFAALVAVDELQPPNPPAALALRQVIFGGEALNLTALRPWMQRHGDASPELVNMYGITETTVHVTYRRIVQADVWAQSPPSVIGEVLDDLSALVLTPQGGLCPLGVAGELYVGGAGLARGYLNRSELTAQRFIANPFHDAQDPRSSERLYRTGDLVRYQADRTLEYLGRIDEQVKIRGFRIELGEIEAQLAAQDGVSNAVVLVQETQPGDKRLIGYVAGSACTGAELKSKLREVLPEYMVPTHIVVLEQLPLTTNGKVDRKALPEPSSEQQEAVYEAPVTSTEKLLASIWAELLQVDVQGIGAQANFFALGGHSLMVIRLMARLQEVGHAVEVRSVFAAPTLRALAQAIDAAEQEGRAQQAFQAPPNAIPAGCERLTPEMLPLVQLTQAQLDEIVGQVPGGAANVQDIYPLAPLQEGMLLHHLIQPDRDPYVLPLLLELDSPARLEAFLTALQQVVDRHDALRTAFVSEGLAQPVQVVWRQASLQQAILGRPVDELQPLEAQLREALTAPQGMDVTHAPLLRVRSFAEPHSPRRFVFLQLHHLVDDATSLGRIHEEVTEILAGRASGLATPVPYREHLAQVLAMARANDAEAYFCRELSDVDAATMPFGLRNVHGDGSSLDVRRDELAPALAQAIKQAALRHGVSPAALFHAAWALVVSATSGRDDVVFGTVLSGRLQGTRGAERTLGMFINTLPLRLRLKGIGVVGLLRHAHEALRALLPFEHASLALAQRCSALPSGTPLFTTMLNFRHSEDSAKERSAVTPGLRFVGALERTNYPLGVSVDDLGTGYSVDVHVDRSVGARRVLQLLTQGLRELTAALASSPERAALSLPLLDERARQHLLRRLRGERVLLDPLQRVHERFEVQAARCPQRLALQCEEQVLSYGELNRRANRLAHLLRGLGVGPDRLVGLCMTHGVEMVVGVLAVLKAGGAYVPLDPQDADAMLTERAEHAGLDVVLTLSELQARVAAFTQGCPGLRLLCLDAAALRREMMTSPAYNPPRPVQAQAQDLAYVIYTSGSTGRPKGVMNEHRGLLNRIDWMQRTYELDESDVVLQKTPFSFDVSVWELTWAFTVGARLVMAKPEGHKDPEYLARLIGERGVSVLHFVPSMLQAMLASGVWSECSSVKQVFCSGEALPVEAVRRHHALHAAALHNLYGPTEAAIDVTAWSCPRDEALEVVPIGRPIQNIELQVLDGYGRLVPQGVAGELHIGGVGLARGYLHREDLTAERFIANPHHDGQDPHSSARLYRTGDLARLRADGMVEYLGRIDEQVKIQAVASETASPETSILLCDPLMQRLAHIWSELLNLPESRIGADDNFFALGGHSLMVVRLMAKLLEQGLRADARTIFEAPNLRALAQAIASAAPGAAVAFVAPPNRIPAACERLTPDMLPLIELDQVSLDRLVEQVPGGAANVQDIYPLAPLQQGIHFHHSLHAEHDPYVLPALLELDDETALHSLLDALQRVIDRHDALRTAILDTPSAGPVQVVLRHAALPMHWLMLDPHEDVREQLFRRMAKPAPLSLSQAPLLRAELVRDGASGRCHVLLNLHHIVSDHQGMAVIHEEVMAHLQGQALALPTPLPYREFIAQAQHQARSGDAEAFFRERLADVDEPTAPYGLLDVHGDGRSIVERRRDLNAPLARRVREAARQLRVSAATLFHAAWALVVSATSGRDDVVFGTVLSGRLQGTRGAERTLGLFINTLPLRLRLRGQSAKGLLRQTEEALNALVAHEQAPLALAQRCSSLSGGTPLFTAILNFRHAPPRAMQAEDANPVGLKLVRMEDRTNYPFNLMVDDEGEGFALEAQVEGCLDADVLLEHLTTALSSLVDALLNWPDQAALSLKVLTNAECDEQLHRLNVWRAVHAVEQGLHERFEAQVRQAPQAIAAEYEGESLSYAELDAQANRLARHLREQGVGVDSLVGLSVERGLPMLVGLLAILKAGGAYVPLDPAYPAGRLAYMVGDSGMKLVLSQSSLRDKLGEITAQTAGIQLLELDDAQLQQQLQRYSAEALERLPGQGPGNLAYIIYTSGSTGQPKGVQIEHANVVRLFESAKRHFAFDASDVWTMFHSYGFDFSVWEIWGALLHGGRLVIVPQAVARSAPEFYELLQQRGVTILNQTPSAFAALVAVDELQPPNPPAALALRQVIFGGEALNLTALRPWMQRHGDASPELVNMYGITETTVHVTYRRIVQADVWAQSPPSVIGEVLDDLSALVLTPQGGLCPLGVAGELYVGGAGLARGYLNRSELTAQRFIANPFHDAQDPRSSERLYRTGDLVRYQADRTLEYLGRIDEQVKIRGFRIELGEIEAQLAAQDGVSNAVVLVQETQPGDKRLIGYVAGSACTGAELKSKLREVLPEYMVPTHIVVLEQLPLTTNGKVDRKALPEPSSEQQEAVYEAPVTSTEKLLASIWAELLQVDVQGIGAQANFFALGGHSLMVIRLMARLQEVGHAVEVRSVFAAPTLRALAQAIDAAEQEGRAQQAFQAPPNAIPAGCERLTPEMLPLVQLTQAQLDEIVGQVPGGAANVQDIYPLAPLQQGIHFHHSLHAEHDPYVLPALLEVDDEPALQALLSALQQVIDRHDALRTAVLPLREHGAVQVVWRQALLPCQELALEAGEDALQQMQRRLEAPQRMVLTQAPLLHAELARDPAGTRCFVLLRLHHIVSDHLGLERVHAEVQACLEGRAQQLPAPLPYREFVAHAQHQARSGDAEEFFRERLADVDEPTAPYGLLDVHGDGRGVVERRRSLDEGLARRIRETARLQRVGPATLFHAAWALVVSATSGRDDVVFGTVLSGRLQGTRGAEHTLGLFINTLPLRLRLRGQSAQGLLRQTEEALTGLLAHEQTPLALAQRCSALPSGTPLFTAMLNYRHDAPSRAAEDVQATSGAVRVLLGRERTNYPFILSVDDDGSGFATVAQLHASIEVERVLDYVDTALRALTTALCTKPGTPLGELPVVPEAERRLQLELLARSPQLAIPDASIHALFEAQAHQRGDALALVCGELSLSYAELDRRANQFARQLRLLGVGPESTVGVCLPRDPELVVALLAILKAGGAYVPLDPSYPPRRLAQMAGDAGLRWILASDSARANLSTCAERHALLWIDEPSWREVVNAESVEPLPFDPAADARRLAYVIYTSGSTGTPKGVCVEHRSVVRLVHDEVGMRHGPDQVFLHLSSISFDAATLELWAPLLHGGRLVLYPHREVDLREVNACIVRHGVTAIWLTSALFDQWSLQTPSNAALRWVLAGGDVVNPQSVRRVQQALPEVTVVNGYGPTENTTFTCCYPIPRDADMARPVPLGRPIAGTSVHVLDALGRIAPLGAPGELWTGGLGLARGYLGRRDLTEERFVPNPFHDPADALTGERLYRTGDRVRFEADGSLAYLGRMDAQIKLRGFRIELGEIEQVLARFPGVAAVAVLAREDVPNDRQLVAYVVPQITPDAEWGPAALEALYAHARALLPSYMVPAHIVPMERLPVTANGKVDRHALPAPDRSAGALERVVPSTATEQALLDLWARLLGVDSLSLGARTGFFAAGGHSLLAIRLAADIADLWAVELPLKAVFELQTVAAIAEAIDKVLLERQVLQRLNAASDEQLLEIEI